MYEYELYHHGIKGMHWGVRRYQNPDGTYTDAGKKRLSEYKEKTYQRDNKMFDKTEQKLIKRMGKADVKGNERKFQNLLDTYSTVRAARLMNNEAIKNMTIADVSKEKRAAAAINVTSALVSVGSVGLVATGMSPVGIISIPDAKGSNTKKRTMNKIRNDLDGFYDKKYNARMDLLEKARPGQANPVVNPYRTIGPVEENATWKAIGNRMVAKNAYGSGKTKKKK